MDKIMNLYNNIRKNNKLLTGVVSALGVCLLAVVVLFVCMPDIKAADVPKDVSWSPNGGVYLMDELEEPTGKVRKATISVSTDGGTINIEGSDVIEKDVILNINYTGTSGTESSPAKVYVNLKNVKITQTKDFPAIALTTNGSPVNFVVTVDGENIINSSCQGATQPLIAVEYTTYTLYKLKEYYGDNPTVLDFIDEINSSKHVGMYLFGESPDDILKLSNAAGSYGALIGSGEVTSFASASQKEMQAYITKLNDDAVSSGSAIEI